MKTVEEHYQNHLSHFYEWMVGDFESLVEQEYQFFKEKLTLSRKDCGKAVDLGCGHGIHTVALSKLGYQVTALDFNQLLLEKLTRRNISGAKIILDNLLNFDQHINEADLIICMGDTIAHLTSFEQLTDLLIQSHNRLLKNGKLVLSFRDYTEPRYDNDRFIPVKADDNKILTCFLEYEPEFVRVTDLLHINEDGVWKQKVSSYKKLRLRRNQVERLVENSGFAIVDVSSQRGLTYLIGEKKA